MYAFLGFCFALWLLVSPGWRLIGLTRQNDLEAGARRQVNICLVVWFALSLLASICWIWFFESSKQYKEVRDEARVPWLWPHADFYLNGVIYSGLVFNFVWLFWHGFLDKVTISVLSGKAAAIVSVLICLCFVGCHGVCRDDEHLSICWHHMLGLWAAGLAFIANIFRISSVEQRDSSWFALSVAMAGTFPEILWMLNVICVECGTVRTTIAGGTGKHIACWDVFFKKNFYWKVSWTLNFMLRLPELALLIRWVFVEKIPQWHNRFLVSAESVRRE